jgi:hypothetical protein
MLTMHRTLPVSHSKAASQPQAQRLPSSLRSTREPVSPRSSPRASSRPRQTPAASRDYAEPTRAFAGWCSSSSRASKSLHPCNRRGSPDRETAPLRASSRCAPVTARRRSIPPPSCMPANRRVAAFATSCALPVRRRKAPYGRESPTGAAADSTRHYSPRRRACEASGQIPRVSPGSVVRLPLTARRPRLYRTSPPNPHAAARMEGAETVRHPL